MSSDRFGRVDLKVVGIDCVSLISKTRILGCITRKLKFIFRYKFKIKKDQHEKDSQNGNKSGG